MIDGADTTGGDEVRKTGPKAGPSRELNALLEALEGLETGARNSIEELRKALCAYVGARRRAGDAAEKVLADVRELVTHPVTVDGAIKVTPLAREALVDLSVRWCTEEFGRED